MGGYTKLRTRTVRKVGGVGSGILLKVVLAVSLKSSEGHHILYIHLFMCMARCRKYCQVSTNETATKNWKAGTRSQ